MRDEEWLVTGVEQTSDGRLLRCQGLSELVRDTTASFYEGLDGIEALDPAAAIVVPDESPHYRRSRLWLEGQPDGVGRQARSDRICRGPVPRGC